MFEFIGPISFLVAAYLLVTFEVRSYALLRRGEDGFQQDEDATISSIEAQFKQPSSWKTASYLLGGLAVAWLAYVFLSLYAGTQSGHEYGRLGAGLALNVLSLVVGVVLVLSLLVTLLLSAIRRKQAKQREERGVSEQVQPSVLGYGLGLLLAVGSFMASLEQFFVMVYINIALVVLVVASTLYRKLVLSKAKS